VHALAKLVGFAIQPLNFLLLLVLAAVVARVFGARRGARAALLTAAAVILVIALTPLADAALRTLEDRFPRRAYDIRALSGAIVLGGATESGPLAQERDTYLLGGAAERLTTAVGLRRRHRDLPIVISGFSGDVFHRGLSEGAITRRLMADLAVPPESFIYEERSRTTYENARYTAELVGTEGRWLLVTSAFHMPRAMAAFRAQGFQPMPLPVDYRAPGWSWASLRPDATARFAMARIVLNEWVGLVVYRVLGRTDTLLPAPSEAPPMPKGATAVERWWWSWSSPAKLSGPRSRGSHGRGGSAG